MDFQFAMVYCRQLKQKIERQLNDLFKEEDISCRQIPYLLLFESNKFLSLNEINLLMDVDKANTTRVIADLINKNILNKTDDIRKYKLFLTSKGEKLLTIIIKKMNLHKELGLKSVTEEEREQLRSILAKIFLNLEG